MKTATKIVSITKNNSNMEQYQIEITYTTSSTFTDPVTEQMYVRDAVTYKPVIWNKLEEARIALSRLADVCKYDIFQKEIERNYKLSIEERRAAIKKIIPDWYEEKKHSFLDHYNLGAINVSHNGKQIYIETCSFRGHFENVKNISIVKCQDDNPDFFDFTLWESEYHNSKYNR